MSDLEVESLLRELAIEKQKNSHLETLVDATDNSGFIDKVEGLLNDVINGYEHVGNGQGLGNMVLGSGGIQLVEAIQLADPPARAYAHKTVDAIVQVSSSSSVKEDTGPRVRENSSEDCTQGLFSAMPVSSSLSLADVYSGPFVYFQALFDYSPEEDATPGDDTNNDLTFIAQDVIKIFGDIDLDGKIN